STFTSAFTRTSGGLHGGSWPSRSRPFRMAAYTGVKRERGTDHHDDDALARRKLASQRDDPARRRRRARRGAARHVAFPRDARARAGGGGDDARACASTPATRGPARTNHRATTPVRVAFAREACRTRSGRRVAAIRAHRGGTPCTGLGGQRAPGP